MRLTLNKKDGKAVLNVVLSNLTATDGQVRKFGNLEVTSLLTEGQKTAGYRLQVDCVEAYKYPNIAFLISNRTPDISVEIEAILVTQHVRILHHDGNYVVILRPTKRDIAAKEVSDV